MKNLIFAAFALLCSAFSIAELSVYADAYRLGNPNYTGVIGVQSEHLGAEISAQNGALSISSRHYLEFENIEIGISFDFSNSQAGDALDWRVIEIEDSLYFMPCPYIKIGSEIFLDLTLDESNTPVFSAGFRLF